MNTPWRLLLIEDDAAVAESLTDALEQEGYEVVWMASGREGIDHARTGHPHLIILDVRLPDGSGFDVCRQMRSLKLHQPILMLTVRDTEADKVLGLEMGADDFVTKPFRLGELLSRIRALLRRAYGELSTTDADLLYVGDLVIDRGRAQVWRGRRELHLTATELRLLVFLATHPGQVMTRTQILDAVWGYDATASSTSAVNVHVRRLREKIEVEPSRPSLILTVPGTGYRFSG